MTFFGNFRGKIEHLKNAHEPDKMMLLPLLLLSVGAVFAGTI
jgi:NADH:ubiquinone oxidoreductase subunit 5 (subunit L)/multisubunit Na+/H+ antiporter MnhA subunit